MPNKNVSVGFFVLGGMLLLGAALFLIGDRRQTFGQHVEDYSEFRNLAGLSKGAKVRVGGMDAGEVLGIAGPDSPPLRFRVQVENQCKPAETGAKRFVGHHRHRRRPWAALTSRCAREAA